MVKAKHVVCEKLLSLKRMIEPVESPRYDGLTVIELDMQWRKRENMVVGLLFMCMKASVLAESTHHMDMVYHMLIP